MRKLLDISGMRYGRLTVIERAEDNITPSGQHKKMWRCRCDCGRITLLRGDHLSHGAVKSCGCLKAQNLVELRKTHGMTNTRLYHTWVGMKQRCYNPKIKSYANYGARGITVCNEWLHDFQAFYDWAIAHGYRENLSIDRISVDGPYAPENCRWATAKEQGRNQRTNHNITIKGETKTLIEWCELYRMDYDKVHKRIQIGWLPEEALGIALRSKGG